MRERAGRQREDDSSKGERPLMHPPLCVNVNVVFYLYHRTPTVESNLLSSDFL